MTISNKYLKNNDQFKRLCFQAAACPVQVFADNIHSPGSSVFRCESVGNKRVRQPDLI